jgi:DNA-binding response OmpR family regulator
VLIVEDDASFARLLKEELQDRGLTSSHAPSAEDALRLVSACRPRAILLDLVLPDEPGEQVLPQLREVEPNAPVVVVTVKDLSPAEARALGVAAIVRKGPGVAQQAANLVSQLLGS